MKWRLIDQPRLIAQLQFEPHDLWVGVFWRRTEIAIHLYVCLLPMIPLHITMATFKAPKEHRCL